MSPVHVVAAVIRRHGKILIGQRRRADWGALQWEFPGGKVDPGESPAEALRRELREELDIDAEIGPEITRHVHHYRDKPPITLIFIAVDRFQGEPQNLAFEQIVWEVPARLPDYDFLEGDLPFVAELARQEAS